MCYEYILAIKLKRYANRLDTKCERGVPNDSRFLAKQLETSDQERQKIKEMQVYRQKIRSVVLDVLCLRYLLDIQEDAT